MTLTDHIALAVDFSEPSKLALNATFKLAEVCGSKRVTILYATRDVVLPAGSRALKERLEKLRSQSEAGAKKSIEALVNELPQHECTVDYVITHGTPARVIPKTAKDIGATMLVLGTHARKGIARFVLGSTAVSMLRGIEIPTMVATAGEDGRDPDAELGAIERVLVAVDLDERADHVVRVAIEAARSVKKRKPIVTLLAVTDVPSVVAADIERMPEAWVDMDELRTAAKEVAASRLAALKAEHDSDGFVIETRVVDGDADEEITKSADKLNAQLIVIGTHGRGHAPLFDLGSTVSHVVRRSNVSVLVVPTPPR